MIVLNMIARNAASTVIDALDSVKAAVDFYVIGFAGKSDDLTREKVVEWLEANAPARFVVDEYDFNNFSDARNRVLAMIPQEFRDDPNSWMMWLDTDDTVLGASELPGILEKMPPEVGVVQFPYIYQTDENDNPMVIHDRERVVRLKLDWYWFRPFHETLRCNTPHTIARFDTLTWVHNWRVNAETRHTRNMALMQAYLADNPDDKRTIIYIGHSYYSQEQWQDAVEWFARYYHDPENTLEQWQAAVFAGDACFQLDQIEMAIGWYMQAIDVFPQYADPFLGIAACYVKQGEHAKAIDWYAMADGKQYPPSILFILPARYAFNRWAYEHFAFAGTGQFSKALEVCEKALDWTKGKHRGFQYYLNGYREALDQIRSKQAFQQLVKHLQERGDALAATEILRFAPKSIVEDEEFIRLQQYAYKAVEHLFNPSIDIYSGDECWAGGSEGAYATEPERMPRVQAVFDVLARHAAAKAESKRRLTVVDFGCGDGSVAIRLAEKFDYRVTGIDTNEANIERARKRADERGVGDKVRFIVGDARTMDAAEIGAHDCALILEVIEHVLDPALLVNAAMEVSDVLIVSTPHQQVGDEIKNTPDGIHLHHVREFDFGMMVRLATGLGLNINTLKTAYPDPEDTVLPGYGQWIWEANKEPANKMPVVFYVGPAAEKWTPEQVNGAGIGGSETAVVHMARLFRAAGHAVFVYGPIDGIYDGVVYRNHKHFDPSGPAAGAGALLFVSSRVPEAFDRPINAAVKFLWCHDNTFRYGSVDRLTPERAEEIDAILVLSEWHKRKFEADYPFAASKLVVTANGIDPTRFARSLDKSERDPHKFVWSSSFDRGLDRVLAMWPQIREQMPDATLDVYYGFDLADTIYGTRNPVWNALREKLVEGMQQDGVNYVGRRPQNELAEALYGAGYWLYPTEFEETYCITALEMQAAGVIPLVSDRGALPERLAPGLTALRGEDDLYLEVLDDVETGKLPEFTDREALRKYALKFTWLRVHTHWKKLIDKYVKKNIAARKKQQVAGNGKQDSDRGEEPAGSPDGGRG